ncbi:prospero homeobox protein 1-like isoform X1 [Acipenser ruthenus]|uniref:prospero homeobox protein 1-like isoform X1 n=1 Tax=Acipenser ruthenus TaxID=7906 RepID=UPI00274204A3|nr:prospero homeobox protein 1-like isoform X1 [Acipenser ruthenus]
MNLSEQNMHSSTESYLVEDKNELSHSSFKRNLYDDSLRLYSNGSIISQLLRKSIQNKRVAEESLFYLPPSAVPSSTTADLSQEDRSSSSSKESTLEPSSPASQPSTTTSFEADGPFNEHRQAKRARVENIIRGMAVFPNARVPADRDRSDPSGDARESYRENKRKQRLPQHQNHSLCEALPATRTSNKDNECHQLKEQLQSMQRLLRQLQEKFFQVYNVSDSEHDDQDETEEASFSSHTNNMNTEFMETSNYDCSAGFDGGFEKMEKVKEAQRDRLPFGNIAPPMLADGKNLSDTLKHELSRVVNESVDSVLKKFTSVLSSQTSQLQNDQESMSNNMASESKNLRPYAPELAHFEDSVKPRHFEYYQNAEAPADEDQTEALSLVVRKSSLNHPSSASQGLKRPYHLPQTPFQFNYHQAVQENQILEHLLKYGPHGHFSSQPCIPPSMDRSSPELVDIPWEAIKVRSKVSSSHVAHQSRQATLSQVPVESLCLPHVKMECGDLQNMAERNPYMSLNIQEGLTPNHLKKAKLMFFYTRYPSSNVLKTFFPDVKVSKFNRCITSQLIKWFSNFREFYYIQMEKFARQAIVDGVNNAKDLTVSRDSELFRALNMHYNKANDFQVPDRFLEVAEITLQEFFNAISMAKDTDPSWKKAIYKVICKLDSEAPEQLKSSNCL